MKPIITRSREWHIIDERLAIELDFTGDVMVHFAGSLDMRRWDDVEIGIFLNDDLIGSRRQYNYIHSIVLVPMVVSIKDIKNTNIFSVRWRVHKGYGRLMRDTPWQAVFMVQDVSLAWA